MTMSRSLFEPTLQATETIERLMEVLLDPTMAPIRNWSRSGALGELMPEWQRLTGSRNIQHQTHHYPLDEHTLQVLEKAKASSYYERLTEYQQFLTTLAVLLHDIDKYTGPARLHAQIPVDKLHPIKSAERSREILTRLGLPPKTVQRVYTLIHHHQAFGRLFILYPNGAPPEPLNKIAVKIRSQGVLDCLAALSEGDIRGVRRGDAFFTPTVAERLSEYARAVGDTIRSFREAMALFPQHLILDADRRGLYPEKSACFVLPAPHWPELLGRLDQLTWGGVTMLPYLHRLSDLPSLGASCAALIRFLPENIAYWGPAPQAVTWESPPSMDLFYGLLLGKPFHLERLSSHDKRLFKALHALQEDLAPMLQAISERQGYDNWAQSAQAFEEGWFEPSDVPLPIDPLLTEASRVYGEHFGPRPAMGIATRPILMGLYGAAPPSAPLPPVWETLPVFQES